MVKCIYTLKYALYTLEDFLKKVKSNVIQTKDAKKTF